ncbi:MAG: hypothetical protein JO166_14145 [Deltaproteobacteria bacterium]|nr:hypothetical protein [Deltaproteobacteria bacterium]
MAAENGYRTGPANRARRQLVADAGKTYNSAMSVIAQRSIKQAGAYMSQYFTSQNWIPQALVQMCSLRSYKLYKL